MSRVLRLYIQMFRSYRLHVCIILETAHLRTTFGIFCYITQKTIPEENNCKMFHISSLIGLFLMGRSRTFWGDKDQISLGRTKGRGKWGYGEEVQYEFFFCKFPVLSKMQTLSQKLLVRQTSNHHHCDKHCQKSKCKDFKWFWAVLPGQKQLCLFLSNKYGFQMGNVMEMITSVLIPSQQRSSLSIFLSQHLI